MLANALPDVQDEYERALAALTHHDQEKGASMTLSSNELKIGAGSEFALPVFIVQPNTRIDWSFYLNENDGDIGEY
jgi:hypothetical protein